MNKADSSGDVNMFIKNGFYYINHLTRNNPVSGTAIVIVAGVSGLRFAQLIIPVEGAIKSRYYNGNEFTAWVDK